MRYSLAFLASFLAVTVPSAVAGDFRIETKIFNVADDERPVSENLTLFQEGVVYDFLEQPKTVTIFRPPVDGRSGSFIVLDPSRSVKMEVTTDQIEGLLTKLREWAATQEDPYLQFLAQPNFVEQSTSDENSLTLSSEYMTYELQTIKLTDTAALEAYRQFSDWYARFNSRGGMLPFPRLAVNGALHRRHRVPTRVVLKIPAQKLEFRAEHQITWMLSRQDRKSIEDTLKQMGSFLRVDSDEFLHAPTSRVAESASR